MYVPPVVAHHFDYQKYNHNPIPNLRQPIEIVRNQNEVYHANAEISTRNRHHRSIEENRISLSHKSIIKIKNTSKSTKIERPSEQDETNSRKEHHSKEHRLPSQRSSLPHIPQKHSVPLLSSRSLGTLQKRIQKERKPHTMPPITRISGPIPTPKGKMFASMMAPTDARAIKLNCLKQQASEISSFTSAKSDMEITDDDAPIIIKVQYDPELGGLPSEDVVRQAIDNRLNQQSSKRNKNDPIILRFFEQNNQSQLPAKPQLLTRPQLPIQPQFSTRPQGPPKPQFLTQSQMPLNTQFSTRPQAPPKPQFPIQSQMPLNTQFSTRPQAPPKPQFPIQSQMPLNTQFSARPQAPPKPQFPTQSQMPLNTQFLTRPQTPLKPQFPTQPQISLNTQFSIPSQASLRPPIPAQLQFLTRSQIPVQSQLLNRPQLPIRPQQYAFNQSIPHIQTRPSLRFPIPAQQNQQKSFHPQIALQPSATYPSILLAHNSSRSFPHTENIHPVQTSKSFTNSQQAQFIQIPRLPNREISSACENRTHISGFDTFKPISAQMEAHQQAAAIANQPPLLTRPHTAPSGEVFRPPPISDIPELSRGSILNMLNQIPDLQGRQFNIEYAQSSEPEGYPIPWNLGLANNSYPEPVVVETLPNNVIQHVKSSNNPAITAALEAAIQREQQMQYAAQTQPSTSPLYSTPSNVVHHTAQPNQYVQQSRPASVTVSDSSSEVYTSETSSSSSSSSSSEETDSEVSNRVLSAKPTKSVPFVGPLPPTSRHQNQYR